MSSTPTSKAMVAAPGTRLRAMLSKNYGFGPAALEGVGALMLVCAALEAHLEQAIWRLAKENPKNCRPSTDGKRVSDLLKRLVMEADRVSGEQWSKSIGLLRDTIQNVLDYRNGIAHGRISLNGTTILNWSPHGEVRKKPPRVTYINERLVGLMADSAVTAMAALEIIIRSDDAMVRDALVARSGDLRKARSASGEVVDLLAVMNNEKN